MSKFNTSNAANSIVNIIQTSIGNAAFDTTIRAIVQEKVDEATGKFKLQYQDGLFYAFADDVKVNYSKGTEVFVLVPKNDFTQDKRIIGSVKTLGENYVSVFTQDERYKKIGKSAFEDNSTWFSIKSKAEKVEEQSNVLYDDEDKDNNSLTLDGNFLSYLKKENVNGLWLEGTFKTYLNQIQDFNGANYGLQLTFSVGEDKKKLTQHTVQLDANSMEGTPFNLSGNRQVIVFSGIDWSTVFSIDKIEFFAEGFSINSVEDDLFVKDIKMYAVSYISDEEQMKSGLTLSSPKGLYIDGAPIDLTATLRIDGKVQRDKVIYYWFIKDPTIKADSNKTDSSNPILVYNAAGGPGWRCLNSATVKEEKVTTETKGENGEDTTSTETIYTINWADGTNTWTFDSEEIPSAQATIMCVAKFENTLYTDTIVIYDKSQTEYFVLTASKEFFTKSEQEITLTLKRQNDQDGVVWETYQWYQQGLYGGAPVPITEGIVDNTTFGVKGSSIVNEVTYMVVVQGTETKTGETISFTTNPVTLSMRLDEQEEVPPQYTLTIINGDQVFQYSEEGYAPNSPAWVTHSPQDIKELSFILFDNQLGSAVDADSYEWTIPADKTLLVVDDNSDRTEETYTFKIASMYNASYSNNQITLKVTYNGMTFTATTNFVFVKQGDPGTNGTEEVYWIANELDQKGAYHFTLYKNKVPVDAIWKLLTNEDEQQWSDTASNKITASVSIVSNSQIKWNLYDISYTGTPYCYIAAYTDNIMRAVYCINWKKEGNTYPIPMINTSLSQGQYIVYDADGQNPKYANSKTIDGIEIPIADKVKNLSDIKAYTAALAKNNGLTGITYELKDDKGNITATYYITLYASLNRHAFSMVNGWDGNLKIDSDGNVILAQTLIAGKKEEVTKDGIASNVFTGIMAGTIGDSKGTEKTGFFGFNQGVQTVFINAETGSATFGSTESAQFKININTGATTAQNKSSIEFTVPYLATGEDTEWEDKSLLKISASDYYLQSANYSSSANGFAKSGTYINLQDGTIRAKAAYFSRDVYLQTPEDYKENDSDVPYLQVGSMLDRLAMKIDSLAASVQDGKLTITASSNSGKTQTIGGLSVGGDVTLAQLSDITNDGIYESDGKVVIAATAIKTGMIGVYSTPVSATPVGWLGAGYGNDGNSDTYGVMLSSADRSKELGVTVPLSNYLVLTSSGVRLTTEESSYSDREYVAASLWLTTGHPATIVLQSDRLERRIWDPGIGKYRSYIIEIEE